MARRSIFESDDSAAIDLSPMIDCIFILLIFFIVTTVFVEEEGIVVNKPDAAAAEQPQEESETITVEITAQNKILFDGREVSLADVTRRVRNGVQGGETPVMLKAHELSAHGTFVEVWDAAKRGGADKLAFTTTN